MQTPSRREKCGGGSIDERHYATLALALGEFGRSSVLAGQRAVPAKLDAAGYPFAHTTLDAALQEALAPK